MRTLNVIETAYGAHRTERADPVIWLVRALHEAGAPLAVLLRGPAVTCASAAPDPAGEVERLVAAGVDVFYVEDDLSLRGLGPADLLPGLKPVGCGDLPELFQQFDKVWHW